MSSTDYSQVVGMAKSCINEQESWNMRLVDFCSAECGGRNADCELVQTWLNRIFFGGQLFAGFELAVRSGELFVPRLVDVSAAASSAALAASSPDAPSAAERPMPPFMLKYWKGDTHDDAVGDVDSLCWQQMAVDEQGLAAALKPHEVLIRTKSAGFNFKYLLHVLGRLPMADDIGNEIAGDVVEVGSAVTRFRRGDKVFAFSVTRPCMFSSHAAIPEALVQPLPANLSYEQGTAIAATFGTACYSLVMLSDVQPGQRVLVQSAASSTGIACVELARLLGAHVVATAGSEERRSYLRDKMGITAVADSRSPDWDQQLLDQLLKDESIGLAERNAMKQSRKFVDCVVNTLSGTDNIRKGMMCLREQGHYVELSRVDLLRDGRVGLLPFVTEISVHSVMMTKRFINAPQKCQRVFDLLKEWFESSKLAAPVVHGVMPVRDIVHAFKCIAKGDYIGKLVMDFSKTDSLPERSALLPLPDVGFKNMCVADKLYLISGGLGGLGFELGMWLAQHAGARYVLLLSRSGKPMKRQRREIDRALHDFGAQLIPVRLDVSDAVAVRALYARVVEQGAVESSDGKTVQVPRSIGGVLQLAMVLDDMKMSLMSEQSYRVVAEPKVQGTLNLLQPLIASGNKPDFAVFFSSISSVIGNMAQANYAAANQFLDQLALLLRQQHGVRAVVLNPGGIDDHGVVAEDHNLRKTISLSAGGAKLTVMKLFETMAQSVAAPFDASLPRSRLPHQLIVPSTVNPALYRTIGESYAHVERRKTRKRNAERAKQQGNKPSADLATEIAHVVEDLLHLPRDQLLSDASGMTTKLSSFGIDSLSSLQLSNKLDHMFSLKVSQMEILSGITIRQLVAKHAEQNEGAAAAKSDEQADSTGSAASAANGGAAARPAQLPVSFEQQRVFFMERLFKDKSGTSPNTTGGAARLRGPLNIEALVHALRAIAQRHEALRTTFHAVEGQSAVEQRVSAEPLFDELEIVKVDSSATSTDDFQSLAQQFVATVTSRAKFDLSTGPLMQAKLLQISEQDHVLAVVLHYIVCDAWSLGVVIHELSEFYNAFVENRAPRLPELSSQYAEFALAERALLEGDQRDRLGQFWSAQLQDAPAFAALPTDKARPAVTSFSGSKAEFRLPKQTVDAIKALAKREQATPFMVLLAVYNALLFALTKQSDVVVGVPVSTRNRKDFEPLIGLFVNTLAVRSKVGDMSASFSSLLREVKASTLATFEHQDMPFEQLLDLLRVSPSADRHPLFQVAFLLQNAVEADARPSLSGLDAQNVKLPTDTSKYDLTLAVFEHADGSMPCFFKFSTDLFEKSTVERMGRQFVALAERVVASTDIELASLAQSL